MERHPCHWPLYCDWQFTICQRQWKGDIFSSGETVYVFSLGISTHIKCFPRNWQLTLSLLSSIYCMGYPNLTRVTLASWQLKFHSSIYILLFSVDINDQVLTPNTLMTRMVLNVVLSVLAKTDTTFCCFWRWGQKRGRVGVRPDHVFHLVTEGPAAGRVPAPKSRVQLHCSHNSNSSPIHLSNVILGPK